MITDNTDKTIAKIINNQKEQNDNTDKNTKDEENLDSDLNKKQAEQYLNMIKDKHNLSIDYFKYTYWIIIGYISIITLIVILIGFEFLIYDNYVINIFLGTTSVNIIGLGYIAMRWLFPNS
ncbi:hypothetical protein L8W64_08220 [Campylobacter sp. IFREMER_LSEM_CL1097]|uniref:hypothetical protein n=1 Tax=Campylobacter sp. IFREMER_LSEM_CL1097 TaxID=2911613 RepID=UPI0021E62878|nr:hypothetical protein [Campylobacter sp. IFREMER_LSEM_CL1097]MCV3443927.1 hypothetical protein [Campylobacter sp. IFREMER_LSEM_CL1097]